MSAPRIPRLAWPFMAAEKSPPQLERFGGLIAQRLGAPAQDLAPMAAELTSAPDNVPIPAFLARLVCDGQGCSGGGCVQGRRPERCDCSRGIK